MSHFEAVAWLAVICIAAYLIGSINIAIIVSRLKGDDIRKHGSGNAGMTNMLRTYGVVPAVITAVGDFAKAVLAVYLARFFGGMIDVPWDIGYIAGVAGYLAGVFVILGHMFPVYFKFKGGKGAMSTLGVVLSVNPIVFLLIVASTLPLILITRVISIASITGAILFTTLTCTWAFIYTDFPWFYCICAVVIGCMILVMHRENIVRLYHGQENGFGNKKQ